MTASPTTEVVQRILFPTKLGWMAAATRGERLVELSFGHTSPDAAIASLRTVADVTATPSPWLRKLRDRLTAFAAGNSDDFLDIAIDTSAMTPFRRRVTETCRGIARGETLSYAELAELVGSPRAARAVGGVMAKNPLPLVVPCHRVLGSAGKLGGYSAPGGLATKRKLLAMEHPPCDSVNHRPH